MAFKKMYIIVLLNYNKLISEAWWNKKMRDFSTIKSDVQNLHTYRLNI